MSDNTFGIAPASSTPSESWAERAGDSPAHVERPGTVVAAAVLAVVTAAFTVVGTLMMTGVVLWLGDPVFDVFASQQNPRWDIAAFASVALIWSIGSSWLALQVSRGRAWARIALAGSSLVTIAVSTMLVPLVLPAFTLLSGVVVLVLLFTSDANEWFRSMQTRPVSTSAGHNHLHA